MLRNEKRRPGQLGDFWLSKRENSEAWCITYFDSDARQTKRISTRTSDLRKAELILAEHVTKNGVMKKEQANEVLLDVVLIRYYEKQAKSLRSEEAARYALRRWSDYFKGHSVSEITPEKQRAFVAAMQAEELSNGYIRRVLSVGQAALNRALREGEIASAPTILLSLAPESEARERVLSMEEIAALFRAADLPHLRDYLILAFATGARPEAILQLTSFQLDFGSGLVRLNPPGRQQNKKRRPTLPMPNVLRQFEERGPGPLVAYRGRALASIKTAFNNARDKAGLDDSVSPYVIRHTVATEMRKRGVPVWEVAAWLGHSTGYRTTERYAKVGPDALQGAIRAVDSLFADLGALLGGGSLGPVTTRRALVAC